MRRLASRVMHRNPRLMRMTLPRGFRGSRGSRFGRSARSIVGYDFESASRCSRSAVFGNFARSIARARARRCSVDTAIFSTYIHPASIASRDRNDRIYGRPAERVIVHAPRKTSRALPTLRASIRFLPPGG
jgi:hypothetical protein